MMRTKYLIFALAVSGAAVASAENVYLNGVWEKGKTMKFSDPQAWNSQKGLLGRLPDKNDVLCIIDRSGYTTVDGQYTFKSLSLGRFLASQSGIGNITFTLTKGSSITLDTAVKAKFSTAISSALETVKNTPQKAPMSRQKLTISGGMVNVLDSLNPAGTVVFDINVAKSPKTLKGFTGGIDFDCLLNVKNDLLISSKNLAVYDGIGWQVGEVSFLGRTRLANAADKKSPYKKFTVAQSQTNYFTPVMIVNVGNEKHPKADMKTGDFKFSRGARVNVFGRLEVNGSLDMSWASELDVKRGGRLVITSQNINSFAEFRSDKLARIRIDGELSVLNPKLTKENTKFVDVQMVVGETGSVRIDGTGKDGKSGMYLERSLLSLQKGAKLYARNMVNLGDQTRLQLFGENQISAREPANGLCRIMLRGKDTIVELHANQKFDSFGGLNARTTLRLCDGANDVSFVRLFSGNWAKKNGFALNIEGFKNGVVRVAEDSPMIATNVSARGWKNFRVENGFLTADAE